MQSLSQQTRAQQIESWYKIEKLGHYEHKTPVKKKSFDVTLFMILVVNNLYFLEKELNFFEN